MGTSTVEIEISPAKNVRLTSDSFHVDLADGRTISAPLAWYPRLLNGSAAERRRWKIIGKGGGIHWEALDEDISVENLLAGRPSGESQASFKKWLAARGARASASPAARAKSAPRSAR